MTDEENAQYDRMCLAVLVADEMHQKLNAERDEWKARAESAERAEVNMQRTEATYAATIREMQSELATLRAENERAVAGLAAAARYNETVCSMNDELRAENERFRATTAQPITLDELSELAKGPAAVGGHLAIHKLSVPCLRAIVRDAESRLAAATELLSQWYAAHCNSYPSNLLAATRDLLAGAPLSNLRLASKVEMAQAAILANQPAAPTDPLLLTAVAELARREAAK
jgi:predicted phage gp36 major capsid-like protein